MSDPHSPRPQPTAALEPKARALLVAAGLDPGASPCDDAWETAAIFLTLLDEVRAIRSAGTPPASREHTLLFPPHPGDVYESSALCSCGEWQFDSGSPHALFNETRLIRREWTLHAAPPEPVGGREALRVLSDAATPGPWAWNSYNAVFSTPLSQEYNRLEALIPDDAPEEAYNHLPETTVITGPPSGHGDLSTKQGGRDLDFIAAAANYVRAALQASPPTGVSDGVALDVALDEYYVARHSNDAVRVDEAIIDVILAASTPTTPGEPAGTLDEAWAEAEAALPEGWVIRGLAHGSPADETEWVAAAGTMPFWETPSQVRGYGSTPNAALRALAVNLDGAFRLRDHEGVAREQADSEDGA